MIKYAVVPTLGATPVTIKLFGGEVEITGISGFAVNGVEKVKELLLEYSKTLNPLKEIKLTGDVCGDKFSVLQMLGGRTFLQRYSDAQNLVRDIVLEVNGAYGHIFFPDIFVVLDIPKEKTKKYIEWAKKQGFTTVEFISLED
jgi:hypothetical protein